MLRSGYYKRRSRVESEEELKELTSSGRKRRNEHSLVAQHRRRTEGRRTCADRSSSITALVLSADTSPTHAATDALSAAVNPRRSITPKKHSSLKLFSAAEQELVTWEAYSHHIQGTPLAEARRKKHSWRRFSVATSWPFHATPQVAPSPGSGAQYLPL